MSSPVICKKNDPGGFVFYTSLVPQTANGGFQANPTIASGDVKVAIDDGAPANIGTLPVVDTDFTKRIKVVLSQGETNGDNITIIFADAAGAEWCDKTINIPTAARGIDDLAYPATTGRSTAVNADGSIDANVTKNAGAAITASLGVQEVKVASMAADSLTASALATDAVQEIRAAVTGGAYALDTDANGRVRIVDGTGAGELDTSSGKVSIVAGDIVLIQSGLATASDVTDAVAAIEAYGDSAWATATGFSTLDAAGVRTAIGMASADLDTQLDAIVADTAEIGAAGAGLTALGDSRLDNLDAAVSTRLASGSYTAPDNSGIAAIQAKTDNLPPDPADASDIAGAMGALASHGDSAWATATGFAAAGDAMTLTSGERDATAAALLTLADGIETDITLRDALRLGLAVLVGKASGLDTTTATFRNPADTTDRIVATVDANGNRIAVTLDAT